MHLKKKNTLFLSHTYIHTAYQVTESFEHIFKQSIDPFLGGVALPTDRALLPLQRSHTHVQRSVGLSEANQLLLHSL